MATVFLAHDLKHDRPVALKVLHPELAAALGAERFLREIRIAAQLQHPHILTLIDSGEVPRPGGQGPGFLYYVMPYVEGESLRERLSRHGRMSPGDTTKVLSEVLDALSDAHRLGIVHRDIKPENIMLSRRHALVMDFGVAKAATAAAQGETMAGGTLTTLGLAIGTPTYMSPEQASGHAGVDARSDVYAVGVLAYEMLSGKPPFTGTTPQAVLAAHVTRTPEPLERVCPDVPPPLAATIARCLAKDPADRWPSAEALLAVLERLATPATGTTAATGGARERKVTARVRRVALSVLILLGGVLWFGPLRKSRERQWAREQGIPLLLALAERGRWDSAFALARRVEAVNPNDSLFRALRPRFARRVTIRTDPAGARVWRKDYPEPDSAWMLLGRTPLDSALLSLSAGGGLWLNSNRLRIDATGYRTLELIGLPFPDSVIRLDLDSAIPREMVRIAGGELDVFYPSFGHVPVLAMGDFLMDRFEVTNAEYRRFVDSGGYRRKEFWQEPFVEDGRSIPWEAAISAMTDRTGRPGPSTWEGGRYLEGQENHPVAGVSWYEAMAYARFAGKSLPTIYHWTRAASVINSAWIVPASNFAGRGTVPVGSLNAISWFGTQDMAGNVREWCLNAGGSERFILGGGWNDQPYQFNDAYTQPPFDRSPTNGIRLVTYEEGEPNLAAAAAPLQRSHRDFLKQRPVSDAVFQLYRRMYEYDRGPLEARVVETLDEGDWTRELIRMNAAYDRDSMLTYLYLPKRGERPYRAVVFFPGSSAIRDRAPQFGHARPFDFIVRSGRAVLWPIYKGTHQRSDSLKTDLQDTTNFYRDHAIAWAKDLARAIDYLETRPEVTTRQLAYYGVSWGGAMGGLMPAVEPRIKVSALYVAGLDFERARPEVDPVNFLPRIRIPTLMINGRYEFFFPLETSQIPMYRLLGTPAEHKRHVVEDGSHFVPRTRLIQEVLAWLDKYQPMPE
jgi:dienelactone hydrolase